MTVALLGAEKATAAVDRNGGACGAGPARRADAALAWLALQGATRGTAPANVAVSALAALR